MKNKQTYLTRGSFGLLFFVFLGYVVKFYPDQLTAFDQPIQTLVRGDLPAGLTSFFSSLTILGDTLSQLVLVLILALFFFSKKWTSEAILILVNGSLAGILIVLFKNLYQRPRPSLAHLVEAGGFSFPSGHSTGSFLIWGTLIIILSQRLPKGGLRTALVASLSLLIGLVGLSRIYLGVHYPSDVLGGFALAYAVLNLIFPFYDQKRFEWRFQSKQK